MKSLQEIAKDILKLRRAGTQVTLLAVCPNSAAVLEAAIRSAARKNSLMLFAATLNQVDRDGGYTGWTPEHFTHQIKELAQRYRWNGPLYPCLDHGGPWLKDRHTLDKLSFDETNLEVKLTLVACLKAGYQLLHIDPTVDRNLPPGKPLPVESVVSRTLDLIGYAEVARELLGLPPVAYEVGTEEVHGGLVDFSTFERFLADLKTRLKDRGLENAWPTFVVAQVGTDLHTTFFDETAARRLAKQVAPMGSLIKGHYTDWVENPQSYPKSGTGGANVGPEFTSVEYLALEELSKREEELLHSHNQHNPSHFMQALEQAVIGSGRWKKWLQPGEKGKEFTALSAERRSWLAQTGARYIWSTPQVQAARSQLYENLSGMQLDAHDFVVEHISQAVDRYIEAFNLVNSVDLIG